MQAPLPPRSRHHHFVPVFMLRRFGDTSGRIVRREARGTTEKIISVRDACVVRDLNIAEEVLGPLPADMFEDALAYVDDHTAPLISDLLSADKPPPISSQARSDIAYFLAWLTLRGPHFRSYVDLMTTREWRERAKRGPADVVAAFRSWMRREPTTDEMVRIERGDFDLEWPRGSQMKLATRMTHVYDAIARYGWILADTHSLLTSDAPVTYLTLDEENALGLRDVGFVPLSTTRVLVLRTGEDERTVVVLNEEQAKAVRRLICERSIDATFRPPGTAFPYLDGSV